MILSLVIKVHILISVNKKLFMLHLELTSQAYIISPFKKDNVGLLMNLVINEKKPWKMVLMWSISISCCMDFELSIPELIARFIPSDLESTPVCVFWYLWKSFYEVHPRHGVCMCSPLLMPKMLFWIGITSWYSSRQGVGMSLLCSTWDLNIFLIYVFLIIKGIECFSICFWVIYLCCYTQCFSLLFVFL